MSLLPPLALLAAAAAAGLLVWAGASDLARYRIPNRASLGLLAAFALFAIMAQGFQPGLEPGFDWHRHLAVGLVAFALGLGAFLMNWAGGGDGKLFAAMALWAGPERILPAIFLMALIGGLLAAAQLLTVQQSRARAAGAGLLSAGLPRRAELRQAPVPYGVAIAGAGLYAIWGLAAPLL